MVVKIQSNSNSFQKTLDFYQNEYEIHWGDLEYLHQNGLVNEFIVDDEDPKASWLLDEDGNYPEVS